MEIKYKIWIEKDGKVVFGRGRDDILKAIDEQRSLNAAAKKLEMSYRAAWGRLKASQERMGMRLVVVNFFKYLFIRLQSVIKFIQCKFRF